MEFRDGQQSLFATRMTTADMAPLLARMDQAGYDSMEMWGGATLDEIFEVLRIIFFTCGVTRLLPSLETLEDLFEPMEMPEYPAFHRWLTAISTPIWEKKLPIIYLPRQFLFLSFLPPDLPAERLPLEDLGFPCF